jgi:hypothetical protein
MFPAAYIARFIHLILLYLNAFLGCLPALIAIPLLQDEEESAGDRTGGSGMVEPYRVLGEASIILRDPSAMHLLAAAALQVKFVGDKTDGPKASRVERCEGLTCGLEAWRNRGAFWLEQEIGKATEVRWSGSALAFKERGLDKGRQDSDEIAMATLQVRL